MTKVDLELLEQYIKGIKREARMLAGALHTTYAYRGRGIQELADRIDEIVRRTIQNEDTKR